MIKQTYEEYKKEQNAIAQKQALAQYKEDIKKNIKPIKTKSKQSEKITKSAAKGFKQATKAIGYKKKLSQTLMGFANANNPPQQKVGRPPKLFKHTSPFTGKPIPAELYYSQMREFKRLQARKVEDAKERQLVEYAKRGVSPSQIQAVQERVRQQQILQQAMLNQSRRQPQTQQNNQQLPNGTVVDRSTNVWRHRKGVVDTDWSAFGRRTVTRGLPESMWN